MRPRGPRNQPSDVSYRRRLTLLAAVAVTLAVAVASVATYLSVRAQLRDSVDDGLRLAAVRQVHARAPNASMKRRASTG